MDLSSSFLYMAMDQFVNQVAKNRYMFDEQGVEPVVFRWRCSTGQHRRAPLRPAVPDVHERRLKIVVPASPRTPRACCARPSVRRPSAHLEACLLWGTGDVPEEEYRIPFGKARTVREGSDVTVVAISSAVPEAVKAADELAEQGISVEVLDPRTLVPLDADAIVSSVQRTGRLIVADPAHRTCSAAAEISAIVAEEAFSSLTAPIVRVTTPDTQIPFSPALEKQLYPNRASIAAAVRRVTGEFTTPEAIATGAPR